MPEVATERRETVDIAASVAMSMHILPSSSFAIWVRFTHFRPFTSRPARKNRPRMTPFRQNKPNHSAPAFSREPLETQLLPQNTHARKNGFVPQFSCFCATLGLEGIP